MSKDRAFWCGNTIFYTACPTRFVFWKLCVWNFGADFSARTRSYIKTKKQVTCWWGCQTDLHSAFQQRNCNQFMLFKKWSCLQTARTLLVLPPNTLSKHDGTDHHNFLFEKCWIQILNRYSLAGKLSGYGEMPRVRFPVGAGFILLFNKSGPGCLWVTHSFLPVLHRRLLLATHFRLLPTLRVSWIFITIPRISVVI
jgi:hypothetical protein